MTVVLGIDPGLRATGYSIIQGDPSGVRLASGGVVRAASSDLGGTLRALHHALRRLLADCRPDLVALEDLFAHPAFPRAALAVAHARGVVWLAAEEAGVGVLSLAPAEVKRVLTGSGRAAKGQMARAVSRLLACTVDDAHVADAAALALTALSRRGVPLQPSSRSHSAAPSRSVARVAARTVAAPVPRGGG
ncbi:MAG: crossover junction endodeoxyribonuclease RuvC [Armatimonadota bacterium]|nr:crossover junction endodeoxyribonuclease RuvC [Armatimonadota bacterium]MDR7449105.1 crossover junction endodeoxyribonuclease RuvC [Armatimonadota bacterium]MDR7459183.1 crossover junction endodeoxyribonuclease RuvC [Armatimonadota bacterium]MDR7480455.1 crossover junction endodeoxyribonuclease RuvC [Armatimonadota bacterium]MDR7489217.1 crossover junction endodeoxyribonuclease RuvC [Armatimonadota bacterium]